MIDDINACFAGISCSIIGIISLLNGLQYRRMHLLMLLLGLLQAWHNFLNSYREIVCLKLSRPMTRGRGAGGTWFYYDSWFYINAVACVDGGRISAPVLPQFLRALGRLPFLLLQLLPRRCEWRFPHQLVLQDRFSLFVPFNASFELSVPL